MIELNLTTSCEEHELIKAYLQENVSKELADKINNGIRIEKDGKSLINKKTLDGFMNYAQDEARKIAEKGKNFKAVHHSVVFGWAIHYFEEDSIEGTLYNEDGTEYKPAPIKKPITAPSKAVVIPKKKPETQFSLFDLMDEQKAVKTDTETVENEDDEEPSEEEIQEAFRPNTKALFGETIANPALSVLDIEKFARIAHKNGVPLIVDNTFPTPINCRPIEFGADIVIHSTTKYMDGHATAVGGCIVDSGNFDWEAHAEKYPGLTEPDPSYHGLAYSKAFGKGAYITKATAQLMRDLGSIQSPENAFLLNLGLETLHLRVPRHCENAQKVAEYLENNPKVAWVNYSGLKSSKYYELAQKQFNKGMSCGVVTFGLKGGREESIRFMDNLKLACIVTHVADARTCVLHPASHTHRQLSDEQLIAAGVQPDLIRFSVGIEDAEDIIADIEQALSK